MSEKTWKLEQVVYTFTQEGNTNGTTQEYEELEITEESVLGCLTEEKGFYVIRTEGWSIDNEEEIIELFKTAKNVKTKE